jgi:VIT1/CCC1 family predicted Fe2+/Mn2+ transporter
MIPLLLFPLSTAIWIAIIWGFLLLGVFSFLLARQQNESLWRVVGEHLLIAAVVILITHYLGDWISRTFS